MNNSKNSSDFEILLQKQSVKKPSALYKNVLNSREETYNPQDVLQSVYCQVKAIQKADWLQSEKSSSKDLNNAKRSHFLPVNKLPVYATTSMNEVPKANPAKFDTQCYLDTQMMNILDGAEHLHTNMGMTQEFDTSFAHIEDASTSNDENANIPIVCENKGNLDMVDSCPNVKELGKEESEKLSQKNTNPQNSPSTNVVVLDHLSGTELNVSSKTATDDTVTFIHDDISKAQEEIEGVDITVNNIKVKDPYGISEDNKELDNQAMDIDTGQYSQEPVSPILYMKSVKRKLKNNLPVVVPLETFENFESMAMSLIEEYDFKTAKQLINSQILGKELCLNEDEVLIQRDSPVLDYKSDELQVNSNDLMPSVKNNDVVKLQDINDVIDKSSDILEDEILFSSDEEDFNIRVEVGNNAEILDYNKPLVQEDGNLTLKGTNPGHGDLPLTCALDTSDDEPTVLENTLFVGFQTASNKSIQICKDSFEKAQSIFGDDTNAEEFSLQELVAKCEKSKSSVVPMTEGEKNDIVEFKSLSNCSGNNVQVIKEDNQNIYGSNYNKRFQTEHSKKISISDKAFQRSRAVFQDFDLSEDLNAYDNDSKLSPEKKNNENVNANVIEDKINDELLLQEFENIEMSLEKENDREFKKNSFEGLKISNNKSDEPKFQYIDTRSDSKISENNNTKAANNSEESNVMQNIHKPSTSNATFVGFKTGNNKEIKISEDDLAKAKDVFKDIGKVKKKIKTIEEFMSPPSSNKSFEGFKTASNKHINISDKALSKTKLVFKDIDKEETQTEFTKVKTRNASIDSHRVEFVGFQTASNKHILISDVAMSKTKNVFKNVDKELLNNERNNLMSSDAFVSFKTARNKDISISKAALDRTKKIFENIDKEEQVHNTTNANADKLSNNAVNCSNKANNESDKVSINSLLKSKIILTETEEDMFIQCDFDELEPIFRGFENSDIETDNITKQEIETNIKLINQNLSEIKNVEQKTIKKNEEEFRKNLNDLSTIKPLESIKTANNKKTNISAEGLEKSKKMIDSVVFDDKSTNSQNTSENPVFIGFQTASKKPVSISKEAIARSKLIFQDIDNSDENIAERITKTSESFRGFQTASKKPATVSQEAIAKSKILFQDIDDNDSVAKKIPKKPEVIGFQTASKKPVDVNPYALIASKKIFEDLNDNQMECSKTAFVRFKTASNKNVNVSKEAMAKSKKLFDEIKDLPLASAKESKEPVLKGFQTANHKKVEVSVEALQKTKNLFDDENLNEKETYSGFIGFQTASNNKVTVSEEALAKSRKLFQEVNDETEIIIDKEVYSSIDASKKMLLKEKFGFQTGRNKEVKISEEALKQSKSLFADDFKMNKNNVINTKIEATKVIQKVNIDHKKTPEDKSDFNIENMIDTQVINNFDENLFTEDFRETHKLNKRSGSPILSCPKAKRRKKFETPYKSIPKAVLDFDQNKEVAKPANAFNFKENYKKNKIYTLEDISKMESDTNKNIDPYILNFNIENLINFEFDEYRNDLKEGKMTIEDIKQIFTEVTDKKLIPDGWLDIQLRLILWKLISYEIRFPQTLGKVCTVKNIIDQLKYRYDKELYNAERPVLRKILEKDDVPMRTMVLCVAGIYVDGVSVVSATNLANIELLLTDGWYFIKATIDNMLSKLVYDGRITVGSKIVTCGAELMNCEQGVAPWEDTSSIRLSLSGNSTFPAPWNCKLGLRPAALLSRLKSVRVGGGKVSRLRVRVTRVYPSLYVEKFPDGSTVTRSERLEHQYQTKYEAENEAIIEKVYEEVQKEMSSQESQDSDSVSDASNKRRCYETGTQIAKMMKTSKDPMEFRAQLTSSQTHLLQDHVSRQRDKYLQTIQSRVAERVRTRNVVTLARGRVVGVERDGDTVTITKGMLSIWKPNDDVLDIFKEGSWIEVTNVVPTAFRNSEIHLSAGRQSVFRPLKHKEENIFQSHLAPLTRSCHLIKDLSQNPGMATEYNEIDTVGIIFSIDPPTQEFDAKNQFQNVYLADVDKNMIVINFWGGIKKFGYENVLDTGQVVYCGNLQKRAGNTRKNIPQYRATEFSLFTKTPKNEKAREIIEEINKKMYGLDRRKFCEDCLAIKQNYSVIRYLGENHNVTPYRFNKSDYNLAKHKMFIDTPEGVKAKNKPEDFNLTGLDFESTFRQPETQELSPNTLQRKQKVNERIAKLKMYGEPPPLSPINIINKSKNATNSYKSPLVKNETVVSNDSASVAYENNVQNIATPIKLTETSLNNDNDVTGSPIISMNRTYVKRSGVNPVKLNFSENASMDKSVDHFAEEFDGSPPLSLE